MGLGFLHLPCIFQATTSLCTCLYQASYYLKQILYIVKKAIICEGWEPPEMESLILRMLIRSAPEGGTTKSASQRYDAILSFLVPSKRKTHFFFSNFIFLGHPNHHYPLLFLLFIIYKFRTRLSHSH